MLDSNVVVIPLQRYEELIQKETRLNVVVERLMHCDFFGKEDILWVLDTELSVELAYELHEKSKKEREEWWKNHKKEIPETPTLE